MPQLRVSVLVILLGGSGKIITRSKLSMLREARTRFALRGMCGNVWVWAVLTSRTADEEDNCVGLGTVEHGSAIFHYCTVQSCMCGTPTYSYHVGTTLRVSFGVLQFCEKLCILLAFEKFCCSAQKILVFVYSQFDCAVLYYVPTM